MDYYNNETILGQAREIESLRQQLVSVAKERDEIAAQARMLDRMVDERDDQLAAALAAIERKDDLLVSIAERWNRDENEEAMKDACWYAINAADHALAVQPDASALKAHDEALIEQCADVIQDAAKAAADNNDLRGYELLRALANAICELKGK